MHLELQLQRAFQVHLLAQVFAPPLVDVRHQLAAYACCSLLAVGALEPDESGIGIAIDHLVAPGFDQRTGLAHDLVAAHGDRRSQARVEEAAAARTQHSVEGIHDDLQRLRQRRVALALGRFPPLPYPLDDGRQAMLATGKTPTPEAFHRVFIVGQAQAFDQPHRVDQESTNDRRVQALVVQHQHRVVQARARIHDEATGTGFVGAAAEVGGDKAQAMHLRDVQMAERGYRTTAAVHRKAGDRRPLQKEFEQPGVGEDARHQLAILEVVARQRRLVLGEAAVDFIHALVRRVDGLAFTEQGLGDTFEAERREAPRRRAQRLDAVDQQPPRGIGEHVATTGMAAQGHR